MNQFLKSVLAVGFSPEDEWALQVAWLKAGLKAHLQFASDARGALASLAVTKKIRPSPALILLNLDGKEPNCLHLVEWARKQSALRELIIMVCMVNCGDVTIKDAYARGADCCVHKTEDFSEVMRMLHRVEDYWYSPSSLGSKAA